VRKLKFNRRQILAITVVVVALVAFTFAYREYILHQQTVADEMCVGYYSSQSASPGNVPPPSIGIPSEGYNAVVNSSDFRFQVEGYKWEFRGWACDFIVGFDGSITVTVTYAFLVYKNPQLFITASYVSPSRSIIVIPVATGKLNGSTFSEPF
jgi:hypothetical protein